MRANVMLTRQTPGLWRPRRTQLDVEISTVCLPTALALPCRERRLRYVAVFRAVLSQAKVLECDPVSGVFDRAGREPPRTSFERRCGRAMTAPGPEPTCHPRCRMSVAGGWTASCGPKRRWTCSSARAWTSPDIAFWACQRGGCCAARCARRSTRQATPVVGGIVGRGIGGRRRRPDSSNRGCRARPNARSAAQPAYVEVMTSLTAAERQPSAS
jgi:hypothetical protein